MLSLIVKVNPALTPPTRSVVSSFLQECFQFHYAKMSGNFGGKSNGKVSEGGPL